MKLLRRLWRRRGLLRVAWWILWDVMAGRTGGIVGRTRLIIYSPRYRDVSVYDVLGVLLDFVAPSAGDGVVLFGLCSGSVAVCCGPRVVTMSERSEVWAGDAALASTLDGLCGVIHPGAAAAAAPWMYRSSVALSYVQQAPDELLSAFRATLADLRMDDDKDP